MSTLTFGSLFAGIGGFDLGFERAGMVCKWQVEIDDFCQAVLTKHWPDVPKYKDVRDVGKHNLETVDVVIGGFPCQPHSVAGKQRGEADDRNLWPEFKRIIDELRPHWVVAENVPGIIHTYLDTVLSDLEGTGYTTGALNIPACGLDARHRRERIFIVAYADGSKRRAQYPTGCRDSRRYDADGIQERQEVSSGLGGSRAPLSVAYSNYGRGQRTQREICPGRNVIERGREDVADGSGPLGVWRPEPRVGRVAHGVSDRVDRLRALGNAIVPQVAEFVGRQIVAVEGAL